MGGEAAKERRRLKRLAAQQAADGSTNDSKPSSITAINVKKSGDTSPTSKKQTNNTKGNSDKKSNASDIALQRFQRKVARKASGKFKPQAQQGSSEGNNYNSGRSPANNTNNNKRKSGEYSDHKHTPNKKTFRGSPRSDNNNRQSYQQRTLNSNKHNNKNTSPKYNNNKKKEVHKKSTTKPKKNKPKHLKRKMEQLSKSISNTQGDSGDKANTMSELEEQMKQLSKQMEEYKRLKANCTDAVVTEDEDKKQHVPAVIDKSTEKLNDKSKEDKGTEQVSSKDTEENNMSSDDSSDDEDIDTKDTKPTKSDDKQETTSSSSSSSSDNSSDDDDASDDDDDDIAESSNTRSRGKRRRGRRDNTKPNDEDAKVVQETQTSDNIDITPTKPEKDKEETETTTSSKKTSKKDDKRRCIGRKPITDYTIGKTYSGTIKYIKPKLGAFIDIGCHSDAFCHISCISNEFVSSVSDVVKEDDIVENVRVIEIDREKKRITVSLRSEDMAENEKERLNTTRQYEINTKKRHTSYRGGSGERSYGGSTSKSPVKQFLNEESTAQSNETKSDVDFKRERKLARRAERRAAKETSATADSNLTTDQKSTVILNKSYPSPHSEKSAADLKRERKIARRAEGRAAAAAAAGY